MAASVTDSRWPESDALAVARMGLLTSVTNPLIPEQDELDYLPPEKVWG